MIQRLYKCMTESHKEKHKVDSDTRSSGLALSLSSVEQK